MQVRTLFAGLAIKPGGVRLGVGPEAAAAGGAALPVIAASCTFVEFATPADALKALVLPSYAVAHVCPRCTDTVALQTITTPSSV
jgi:hypothetical protein